MAELRNPISHDQRSCNKGDLQRLVLRPSFVDSTGKYIISTHAVVAHKWTLLNQAPLCIAFQANFEQSFQLIDFLNSWTGAVSCALFTPGQDFHLATAFLSYLNRCHPAVARQVNFHFIYPKNRPPPSESFPVPDLYLSCGLSPQEVVEHLLRLSSNRTQRDQDEVLPISLMRNVARTHCSSPWVMSSSPGIILPGKTKKKEWRGAIERFLLKEESAVNCSKRAYILPIYEVKDRKRLANKSELLSQVGANKARQYLGEVAGLDQRSTDLSRWEKVPPGEGLGVAYPVEKFIFPYVPVYIAKQGTPRYDERYLDPEDAVARAMQTYDMMMNNYTFHVVDNLFLYRKVPWTEKWNVEKENNEEVQRNNRSPLLSAHVLEFAAKYDRDPLGLLWAAGPAGAQRQKVRVILKTPKAALLPEKTNPK
ncbi:beta-1,4-glucuronyltransferase 1-like isoform X2 [Neocloeon triangulifer]|uniref:beta-1,4-glucuronyltransferase 1-like isoform X2 n=1 Tax=Neocloeon triangulifer TaxID=2078957 RepID=UPI00286F1ABA|nr:beta-1,4-glucuronyltransferase 1-like isoform X2 [Neocloeon triangulifer]